MLRRPAWVCAIVLLLATGAARAQQPYVQVSAAAQVFTADTVRMGGLNRVEPDLGLTWFRPNFWQGTLNVDVNVTRRNDKAHLGRAVLGFTGVRLGGFRWDVSAGDTGTPPLVPDFGFSNLRAPAVMFAGATVAATSNRLSFQAASGHTTQTRNVFGTDVVELDQAVSQAGLNWRVGNRVDLVARGSHVRNGDMGPYPVFVDFSTDVGVGVRFRPAAGWQLVADTGFSWFRRRGSPVDESAPSWLVGTSWTGTRGFFELNAQRFSVGRFAASNYPYNDRQGVFASGEFSLATFAHVFGGTDVAATNLDPDAAAQGTAAMPEGNQTRNYGGVRLQFGKRATFTVRAEGGGRAIRPSQFASGYESDTGSTSAEWHVSLPHTTVFARYDRRTNVDALNETSSYRQHEASGHVYFTLPKGRQLFGQASMIRRLDRTGGGQLEWYSGGGFQMPAKALFLRFEGTVGRTDDWTSGRTTTRQMLVLGLSGQIAERTFLSADVVLNHVPLGMGDSHPWSVRSMLRVTRTLPYGSGPILAADGALLSDGPSGSLHALVFVDWNANGVRDQGDEARSDVIVSIARVGAVATGRDGRASFSRVPVGERTVGLDLASVPADFDVPADTSRPVTIARSQRATESFGLIPVGSISGTIYADVDGDGQVGPADTPVEDAVVTIDNEARSELARDGRFRFDNVRFGPHTVALPMDSLEDGAQLAGPSELTVELTRDSRTASVAFLVKREKRPEVRRVFPVKRVRVPDQGGAADADESPSADATVIPDPAPAAAPPSVSAAANPQAPAGGDARATGAGTSRSRQNVSAAKVKARAGARRGSRPRRAGSPAARKKTVPASKTPRQARASK